MLSFHDLTKRYGSRTVLAGASADVRPGRITGLLGPNGAGKTTLLKIVLGLTTPDGGTVERPHGPGATGSALDIAGFRKETRIRTVLTAEALRRGLDVDVDALVAHVGLPDPRQRVGTLSLGMTQRVRVAMALLGRPQLLVLDEPLNGLDPRGIRWLRELLRSESDKGAAVLVSSHLLHEAEHIVDDVVILDGGRVVAAGPRESLLQGGTTLESLFFALTEPADTEARR